ncbi:MAG: hypothetical protein ACK5VI_09190 [Opitutia bacterium]
MIDWKIEALSARSSEQEINALRPDDAIVVSAKWRVFGWDGDVTANVAGVQEFVYDPTTDFTPYYDLTEAQVLGWVHAAMGDQRTAYEDMVMQQVAQKKAEPLNLPLPWLQAPIMVEQPSGNDTLNGGNGNDSLGGVA